MSNITYEKVANRLAQLGYAPVDSDKNAVEFETKLILAYVVNYCNFSTEADIPAIVEPRIIDRICAEYLMKKKNSGQLANFNYEAFIKQIKEGDTTIQFGNESDGDTVESRFDKLVDYLTKGFDKWISPWRRIRW